MKLKIEEDSVDKDGNPCIVEIREVKSKEEALSSKKKEKTYLHKCRHDEGGTCSREVL